jgi:hypothetical protein
MSHIGVFMAFLIKSLYAEQGSILMDFKNDLYVVGGTGDKVHPVPLSGMSCDGSATACY